MRQSFRRGVMQRVFHLLYHQFAWSYDAVSAIVSLGRWQAWGETVLPFLSPGPVLELGHGPGHLLLSMWQHGWNPVGIDLSQQMGQMAGRRLNRQGIPRKLVRGRGQALPFAEGYFNTAVAVFPAPYIVAPETLSEVWRVLQPGGRLVIIPEAQLVGSNPLNGLIECLYSITGQRRIPHSDGLTYEWYWEGILKERFSVSIHHVPRASSLVTVIVAERNELL